MSKQFDENDYKDLLHLCTVASVRGSKWNYFKKIVLISGFILSVLAVNTYSTEENFESIGFKNFWGRLATLLLLALASTIANFTSKFKAFAHSVQGFETIFDLNKKQKYLLGLLNEECVKFAAFDKSCPRIIALPNDIYDDSSNDKKIMQLMAAKYGNFTLCDHDTIFQEQKFCKLDELPPAESSSLLGKHTPVLMIINPTVEMPNSSMSYYIIKSFCTNHRFDPNWHPWFQHLHQQQGLIKTLGISALSFSWWTLKKALFKWIPAAIYILTVNHSLFSLGKRYGFFNAAITWRFIMIALMLTISITRMIVSTDLKGNEALTYFRTLETTLSHGTMPRLTATYVKNNVIAFLFALVPSVLLTLYFISTAYFFSSNGLPTFGEEYMLTFGAIAKLNPITNKLSHFIATIMPVLQPAIVIAAMVDYPILGWVTYMRSLYNKIYKQLTKTEETSKNTVKGTFFNIARVSITVDSLVYASNGIFTYLKMLASHALKNRHGGKIGAIISTILLGAGLFLTNTAWSLYTAEDKFEALKKLFKPVKKNDSDPTRFFHFFNTVNTGTDLGASGNTLGGSMESQLN